MLLFKPEFLCFCLFSLFSSSVICAVLCTDGASSKRWTTGAITQPPREGTKPVINLKVFLFKHQTDKKKPTSFSFLSMLSLPSCTCIPRQYLHATRHTRPAPGPPQPQAAIPTCNASANLSYPRNLAHVAWSTTQAKTPQLHPHNQPSTGAPP